MKFLTIPCDCGGKVEVSASLRIFPGTEIEVLFIEATCTNSGPLDLQPGDPFLDWLMEIDFTYIGN